MRGIIYLVFFHEQKNGVVIEIDSTWRVKLGLLFESRLTRGEA